MTIRLTLPAALLISTSAMADVPSVVTDILPVHSLVATVMKGVGTPELLLPPGIDPHDYALRPSEARALSNAQIVIWVGDSLTPWLAEPIETIASGAQSIELMEAAGFEPRELEEEGHHDDEDGHDDHDDHAEEGEHDHDDHAKAEGEEHHDDDHDDHGHDDHAGHDHGGVDPHAWLDPASAAIWLDAIGEVLATSDPDNAATYRANAKAGVARFEALETSLQAKFAPVSSEGFVTYHDAFGYFIDRFELNFEGSLASSEASDPSPADIQRVKDLIADGHVSCAFSEAQLNPKLLDVAAEGSDVGRGELDPLGAFVEPGPDALETLLTRMGDTIAGCLGR